MTDMADVKYPEIEVALLDSDGNAMMILGRVGKALRQGGVPREEIDRFHAEATSGDYDHLLTTCLRWVTVT